MDKEMHPIVKLARDTVESYISSGNTAKPEELISEMKEQAGVFVSIHKHGQLRGCIGTFEAVEDNVAEEIMANAISSATRDPRFPQVEASELAELEYNVDILSKPEPAEGVEQLDPERYGVIVESGLKRGLLLPDLDGVDTVEKQIEICRMKAGIPFTAPITLYRFEVRRYK